MQQITNKNSDSFDDFIDLQEFFHALIQGKWLICAITSLVTIAGVIYSLYLPNVYESKALLVPVNSSNSISGGLAGIDVPSARTDDNSAMAIRKISSLSFFKKNLLVNMYLPNLMAFSSWDHKTNTLYYDESVYNIDTDTWIRDYSYPKQQIPSAQESFEVFISEHLSLSEDKKSGFITMSIKHQSPFIAKQWAELIVNEVNNFYRQKDKKESEKASNYLNNQISLTSFSEIKQVLAQLLQEETKKLTLIEANTFYVFDYVDPPAVMEKRFKPKRFLIAILSFLVGLFVGTLLVLTRYYVYTQKSL
jgi:capsular polysaccharide biosynthesis protein